MIRQLLPGRNSCHVPRNHLKRPLCWLPARPNHNQHACDDRAIRLNFNSSRVQTQLMTAAQNMLEHPEKDLDRPPVPIDVGDQLGRHVQHVGRDSQYPVAGWPRRLALAAARFGMRLGLDQNHANLVIRAIVHLAVVAQFRSKKRGHCCFFVH